MEKLLPSQVVARFDGWGFSVFCHKGCRAIPFKQYIGYEEHEKNIVVEDFVKESNLNRGATGHILITAGESIECEGGAMVNQ